MTNGPWNQSGILAVNPIQCTFKQTFEQKMTKKIQSLVSRLFTFRVAGNTWDVPRSATGSPDWIGYTLVYVLVLNMALVKTQNYTLQGRMQDFWKGGVQLIRSPRKGGGALLWGSMLKSLHRGPKEGGRPQDVPPHPLLQCGFYKF